MWIWDMRNAKGSNMPIRWSRRINKCEFLLEILLTGRLLGRSARVPGPPLGIFPNGGGMRSQTLREVSCSNIIHTKNNIVSLSFSLSLCIYIYAYIYIYVYIYIHDLLMQIYDICISIRGLCRREIVVAVVVGSVPSVAIETFSHTEGILIPRSLLVAQLAQPSFMCHFNTWGKNYHLYTWGRTKKQNSKWEHTCVLGLITPLG